MDEDQRFPCLHHILQAGHPGPPSIQEEEVEIPYTRWGNAPVSYPLHERYATCCFTLMSYHCALTTCLSCFVQAQNIKNFKSQRWQTLLNFNSQRRLLLTGTPLQNNLMELWSLMHFLMPNVFQSHMDFKEWFANPVTGMIEGNTEYNEQLIRRLHKVCHFMPPRTLDIE